MLYGIKPGRISAAPCSKSHFFESLNYFIFK